MFLGEILRRALLTLLEDPKVPLFNNKDSTTHIASDSPLHLQWGLDTSFLSITAADASVGLKATRQALDRDYGVSRVSAEDAEAVRLIASAIGKRAARLAAVAVAAVVISTGKLSPETPNPTTVPSVNSSNSTSAESASADDSIVDIGVDGSLVEFYPNFEDHLRAALRAVPEIGDSGEKRIRIGIAKDGSGVGAALIALVADQGLASNAVLAGKHRRFASGESVLSWLQRFWEDVDRNVRFRV
jgi:hexokinase